MHVGIPNNGKIAIIQNGDSLATTRVVLINNKNVIEVSSNVLDGLPALVQLFFFSFYCHKQLDFIHSFRGQNISRRGRREVSENM